MAKGLIRFGKNVLIGGAAGMVAARIVTDVDAEKEAGKKGLRVGAAIGALSAIPGGKALRGLKEAGKAAHYGVKNQGGYKVIFKRIGGRVVPIKAKA